MDSSTLISNPILLFLQRKCCQSPKHICLNESTASSINRSIPHSYKYTRLRAHTHIHTQVALYSSAPCKAAYIAPATLPTRVAFVLEQLVAEAKEHFTVVTNLGCSQDLQKEEEWQQQQRGEIEQRLNCQQEQLLPEQLSVT